MFQIRPATRVDVPSIIEIHISTWQAQFTPFLSAEQVKLKNLDEAAQMAMWQDRFTDEEGISRWTLIATDDNEALGYITGHATSQQARAELHQIYVQPSAQGQNMGQALVAALASTLNKAGFTSLFVWVMTINPAIAFYRDRLGGTFVTERAIPDGDGILREAQFEWTALEHLF